MANFRTSSLFHYTENKDSLLAIIESGMLYPNFCEEDLSTENNLNYILGIPQICFCDIPISLAEDIRQNYKPYAIAFTKKWGIENGCNPIQYVSNEAVIDGAIHYWERVQKLHKEESLATILRGDIGGIIKYIIDRSAYANSIGFMKKYESNWKGDNYCNYKENEWRYIISDIDREIKWKTREQYNVWRWGENYTSLSDEEKDKIHKPKPSDVLKERGLKFTPENITHIILEKDSDVRDFSESIMNITSFSDEEKYLLLTKITTFERISQDY